MSDVVAPTHLDRPARQGGLRLLRLGVRTAIGAVKRFERYFDDSHVSRSSGARRMRMAMAAFFGGYAGVLEVTALRHGGGFPVAPLFLLMLAVALFLGRGGTFVSYFLPVFLGLFAYVLAGSLVAGVSLPVHYTPQLDLERLLPGPLPSVWLQQHLYHGTTGPLETFAVAMYISHFAIPLFFGFGLAMTRRATAFSALMFGLLAVSVLGEITFVLAPTAPPWLAAQEGYVSGIHHILKQSLYDLHLTSLADVVGDKQTYDTTAAVPSLHAAFPFVCLLTAWRYGLPRWLRAAFALNVVAVSFSVLYTGDHYLVDVLAGVAYAAVAFALVDRLLRFDRRTRPEAAAIVPAPASTPREPLDAPSRA